MNKEQWVDFYIKELLEAKRLSSNGKVVLDLYNRPNRNSVQEKMLTSVLDGEFKAYLAKLDFDKAKKNANAKAKSALEAIKKTQLAENKINRKNREHELITIGALVDVVGFEKDRGLIAGALLHVLDKIVVDSVLKNELKKRGDELLHEVEQKNKKSI